MSLVIKRARAASQGGLSGNVQSGGIFDFLKGVGRVAIGAVTGGPAGGLRAAVNQITGRRAGTRPPLGSSIALPAPPSNLARAGQILIPGGRTGLEGLALACPTGHHANKSSYFLLDGSFVEKGSRCVKNRRRNPMNPRALSRAISRVDSGKALQGRLAEISTAKWTGAGKRKHPHG